MDDFTDALMVALHAGADDPDRSAMGSRMKTLSRRVDQRS